MELKFAKPQRANVAMVKERGSSVVFHRAQPLECDELICDHAKAQKIADRRRVMPRNSDQPCDGARIQPIIPSMLVGNHSMRCIAKSIVDRRRSTPSTR